MPASRGPPPEQRWPGWSAEDGEVVLKRDLPALTDREFDVLVIGGGIYGAWTVWDATLRGLSAALIDRDDFGAATSSNNFKLVHGGLRYLQHLDVKRMRESIREQRALRRVAPHLVQPMPCLVPTYGSGLRGRAAMRVAMLLNDLISFDRNRGVSDALRLAGGRILSAREVSDIVPGVPGEGLTGAALWNDAQLRNPDRLLLSVVRAAAERGAVVANHVESRSLLKENGRVVGAQVHDRIAGETFPVRARMTLNTAGPWVDRVLEGLYGDTGPRLCPRTQAWNLVLGRLLVADHAVGLYSTRGFADRDRKISRGGRLIFFAPWRGRTLVGTSHGPLAAEREVPDPERDRSEMLGLLAEAADAYPAAQITEEDIAFAHFGVLPGTADPKTGDVRLQKQYLLRDHAREDGISGLLTCVGVKFTTARDVAEKLVDAACAQLGTGDASSRTAEVPIWGGDVEDWQEFRPRAVEALPAGVPQAAGRALIENHGTAHHEVLAVAHDDATLLGCVPGAETTIKAEVLHAIRDEMAITLLDVVRRRTEIGTAEAPDEHSLDAVADLMAAELGWSAQHRQRELDAARSAFRPFVTPHASS